MITIPIEHLAAGILALAICLTILITARRRGNSTPVVLVRTRAPLPAEDTRKAISSWMPTDPTRQAVEDAFDVFLADAVAGVCREDATPEQRAFASGALDGARRFQTYLFSLGNAAEEPRRR
jgi:hypothetical protein